MGGPFMPSLIFFVSFFHQGKKEKAKALSGRHLVGDNTNKVEKLGYTSRRFFVGENTNKGERANYLWRLKTEQLTSRFETEV